MIIFFSLRITREQKEALLSFYPGGVKQLIEKTISDMADKIIFERDLSNVEEELKEFHDRKILNKNNIHGRKCTLATKNKITKALKAKGWKGIPLLEETVEKLKGHIVTKGTRDLISKGNKGKKRTERQRENLSLGHTGLKYKKRVK